mgnify:CR=1 FL=1
MQKCNENAANRYSYVGEVYNVGERKRKEEGTSVFSTPFCYFWHFRLKIGFSGIFHYFLLTFEFLFAIMKVQKRF